MTNEQLCILIQAYTGRLELEIDILRSKLPANMERVIHTDREYVGQNLFGGVLDSDPMHWRVTQRPGEFVVLLGLAVFLDELKQAQVDLESKAEEGLRRVKAQEEAV